MTRVGVYVDGFNLYYGLRVKYGRRYLWLDLQALATSLLRPGQVLQGVAYFTARVLDNPDSLRRQSDVNIAISLVEDAVEDRYDTAILISGDSDLIPAIKATKRLTPGKRVIVAFPQTGIPPR